MRQVLAALKFLLMPVLAAIGLLASEPRAAIAQGDLGARPYPSVTATSTAAGTRAAGPLGGSGAWLAAGPGPQSLVWGLGTPNRITSLRLVFPATGCLSFTVDTSDNGSNAQPEQWANVMTQPGRLCSDSYSVSGLTTARYVRLTVFGGGRIGLKSLSLSATPVAATSLPASVLAAAAAQATPSAPVVVMEACDLWSSQSIWQSVLSRAPYNRPLAGPFGGLYDDADPDTTTARILLARRAGIGAFQGCWYRQKGNAGQPVQAIFNGVVRALADTSPARSAMKFDILWDNANPVDGGISDADDFLDNLASFWIGSYFTRTNYLRVDGRPVLVIASAEKLADQLGGTAKAAATLARFRARAVAAGLPGLMLLAVNNGSSHASNAIAAAIGFDGVMAYSTPAFTGTLTTITPTAQQLAAAEKQSWSDWAAFSALPSTLTVSMGYDSTIWSNGTFRFRLSPSDLAALLRDALSVARATPATALRHQLVFVDNWNEYGEGRFIEPSLAYGGSYLNAISAVICPGCGFNYIPARGLLPTAP